MAASACCRTASACCRRKVAAFKIEKLKAFIIKYYDISKTYSLQFHLFYSVNLPYFYFFIHGFQGSRTIAPRKNCPPTPKLTLNQILTLPGGGGQFSSGAIVPNTNPNWGGEQHSSGGNCPDTGFQSSILHKLKNTLNCLLKLSKDNNRSFLVASATSINKHNYLIYKNKQYKSCNLKIMK